MATFYIDYGNAGSNTNPGTKTSPWKSHPYMQTATSCTTIGSGPSYPTHTAGDIFIFKGGVTWPAACFPMVIPQGGSSNVVRDLYKVDQTWFSGTSFTKPKFDGTGATLTTMVYINANNVTLDTLDIGGNTITSSVVNVNAVCGAPTIDVNVGQINVTVTNSLLHDWKVTTNLSMASHSIGGMCSESNFNGGDHNIVLDHSEVRDDGNIFNGSSLPVGSCAKGVHIAFSHCHFLAEGIVGHGTIHDSEFDHINPAGLFQFDTSGAHPNTIETDVGSNGDGSIYNNVIHDNLTQIVIFEAAQANVYNNVFWNNTNNGQILVDTSPNFNAGSATANIYNNTMDCTGSSDLRGLRVVDRSANGGSKLGTLNFKNNIMIGCTADTAFVVTVNQSNNPTPTSAHAAAQGLTVSNKYVLTSASTDYILQGNNLTSLCSGNDSAGFPFSPLCKDNEGAPWFSSSYQNRPATGNWDIGAYVFPQGTTTPPTVTITSPPAGTVSGTQTLTLTCSPTSPNTVSTVYFQIDGTVFGSTGSVSPFSQTWDTTTASNASHTIAAFCVDSGSLSNSTTETVTVSNNMPGCFVSSNNWSTNQSFTTQTGQFVAAFTVKPNALAIDDVVGFSSTAAGAYTDLAAIVRFNTNSTIDVRNAGVYQADNVVSYTAGTVYAFSLSINVLLHTYSVQLTSPSNVAIATNYAFRSEQSSVTSLSFVNMQGAATPNTAQFCNLVLNPPTAGPGGSTAVGSAQRFTVTLF